LNAIVVANFKVHRPLVQGLPDFDDCGPRFVEQDSVAHDGDPDALVVVSDRVRWIDPLPFRNPLIGQPPNCVASSSMNCRNRRCGTLLPSFSRIGIRVVNFIDPP
jgi:hypothetical protein